MGMFSECVEEMYEGRVALLEAALKECVDVMKLPMHKPCVPTCEDIGCRWHLAVQAAEELLP